MKNAAVMFSLFAALAIAQEQAPETVKRLDSVTWDLNTHKLVWVVQTGKQVGGEFVPDSSSRYEVSPDEATMASVEEKRGFTEEEAASLHHLLDVLSLYCAESTVWWEKGEGTPMGKPTERKTTAPSQPGPKPVRVNQPQAKPPGQKKAPAASGDTLVAGNRGR